MLAACRQLLLLICAIGVAPAAGASDGRWMIAIGWQAILMVNLLSC
jgi:hypothetical protein